MTSLLLLMSAFVVLSKATATATASSSSNHNNYRTTIVPSWQTVLPDAQVVRPLFGEDGPEWRLDYRDTVEISVDATATGTTTIVVPHNLTTAIQIPGDLISDLMRHDLVQDPYVEFHLWNQQETWLGPQAAKAKTTHRSSKTPPKNHRPECQKEQTRIWTYSTEIAPLSTLAAALEEEEGSEWKLVIEGIQMGATVTWNGIVLGNVTDQFLRYIFTVPNDSSTNHPTNSSNANTNANANLLEITFDPSIDTNGRFMACSGGWDWAPYTLACDQHEGRRTFSMGVVAPLYLVQVHQVMITQVVPKVYASSSTTTGDDKMVSTTTATTTTAAMDDRIHPKADFKVQVEVHLDHVAKTHNSSHRQEQTESYYLLATSEFAPEGQLQKITSNDQSSKQQQQVVTFTMTAPKETIELWWPNGMGSQPLYNIQVTILSASQMEDYTKAKRRRSRRQLHTTVTDQLFPTTNNHPPWIQKRIGFRTTAIVTINESSSSSSSSTDTARDNGTNNTNKEEEGTGLHGMYFRVNGALVMARGANVIPADQLAGRYPYNNNNDDDDDDDDANNSISDKGYRTMMQSAADAHMNMVRVWGGGKVLPKSFYDACDELGIMVYHDQMFAQGMHSPAKTDTIEREIQHIVHSLAAHPSIVVWNGCNECKVVMGTDTEIYASFVMRVVAEADNTRSVWASSPSKYGWKTGVNRYDSKPNGNPLATRDPNDHKKEPLLESHGPYMRAFSEAYPAVNGVDQHFGFSLTPNEFYEGDIGPQYQNTFFSEFGASVWSSFESMSGTLLPEHWGLHGGAAPDTCDHLVGQENVCRGTNVLAQRNYPCDTYIQKAFGDLVSIDAVGEISFRAQLYQCNIAQAMWMKNTIESRRSSNSFGMLIWQLNENWPTGGWGLVEYSGDSASTSLPGQVVGGRWKPILHLLHNALFRDVIAACGRGNRCFVRNDGMDPVDVVVRLEAWNITSASSSSFEKEFTLKGGVSETVRFQMPLEWHQDSSDAVILRVTDSKNTSLVHMEDSVYLWTEPLHIANLWSSPAVEIEYTIEPGPNKASATVTLSSDSLALYVVLSTKASGRFSDNAFVLRPHQSKIILFSTLREGDEDKGGEVDLDLLTSSLRLEHLASFQHQKEQL